MRNLRACHMQPESKGFFLSPLPLAGRDSTMESTSRLLAFIITDAQARHIAGIGTMLGARTPYWVQISGWGKELSA